MLCALQLQGRRSELESQAFYVPNTLELASVSKVDTIDLDEYLVDETDGMEQEFDMEPCGDQQLGDEEVLCEVN